MIHSVQTYLCIYVSASNFDKDEYKVSDSVSSTKLDQTRVDVFSFDSLPFVMLNHKLHHTLASVFAGLGKGINL